jgi:YVTN family beta-propeller protein
MRKTLAFLTALSIALLAPQSSQAEGTTAETTMSLTKTITGNITPKSVHASGTGVVAAFNMMYRHSVTLYDANTMTLLKTIQDSVKLSDFGFPQFKGVSRGAPVEGAFSPDGKYLYATNYSMYGNGFGSEGQDTCVPSDKTDRSFLYRINLNRKKIDKVYYVGSVPKVVAVTPDNRYVLVTNWCSWDLNIISTATQTIVKTMYIGRYPRGITVSPDSKYVYIAEMGSNRVHQINLNSFRHTTFAVGSGVRALVLSPDGTKLYATLNAVEKVAAYDLVKRKLIKSVKTGAAPRSLTISTDGSALFAVNFKGETLSKIRTSDMKVLQTIDVCKEPIGVDFEATTQRTWVACYRGQIKVFDNK